MKYESHKDSLKTEGLLGGESLSEGEILKPDRQRPYGRHVRNTLERIDLT